MCPGASASSSVGHPTAREDASRRRDRSAGVPPGTRLAERRNAAHAERVGGPGGALGVLGFRADQLAADAPVCEGVARALLAARAAGDRCALARLLVRACARAGGGGGRAARDPLCRPARPALRGLAALWQQGLARALPVR